MPFWDFKKSKNSDLGAPKGSKSGSRCGAGMVWFPGLGRPYIETKKVKGANKDTDDRWPGEYKASLEALGLQRRG